MLSEPPSMSTFKLVRIKCKQEAAWKYFFIIAKNASSEGGGYEKEYEEDLIYITEKNFIFMTTNNHFILLF